jgi:hypothetical protein
VALHHFLVTNSSPRQCKHFVRPARFEHCILVPRTLSHSFRINSVLSIIPRFFKGSVTLAAREKKLIVQRRTYVLPVAFTAESNAVCMFEQKQEHWRQQSLPSNNLNSILESHEDSMWYYPILKQRRWQCFNGKPRPGQVRATPRMNSMPPLSSWCI